LLNKYLQASNDLEKHEALVRIIMAFPSQVLQNKRGGKSVKNRKNKTREQRSQFTSFLSSSSSQSSTTSSPSSSSSIPMTRSRTAEKLNQPIIAKINHAMTLLSNNHVSKAAQVLCREDSMKNTGEELVRSQLIELHPVNNNVSTMPSPSSLDHSVFINPMDKNMFKNIIKSCDNGSAPGYSGWTASMIFATLSDEFCRDGWMKFVQDIINGELPDQSRHYSLSCSLVAISKPNSQAVRPIAIGEVIYRIAAKWSKMLVRPVLQQVLDRTYPTWHYNT